MNLEKRFFRYQVFPKAFDEHHHRARCPARFINLPAIIVDLQLAETAAN